MKKFIGVLICAFVFIACTPYQSLECTAINGFEVKRLDANGIEADVFVTIKNPNHWGFTIYKSSFDVKYSSIKLGKALLAKNVKIKSREEKEYGFHIRSDFKDITLSQLMGLLGGGFKNDFQLTGILYAGKFGVRKGFPVDLKDHIKFK